MVETLVELVYYYPPVSSTGFTIFGTPIYENASFDPKGISSVQLNDIGMVVVLYRADFLIGGLVGLQSIITNISQAYSANSGLINVYMTPEAYTNWYASNTQAIISTSQASQFTAFNASLLANNQEQVTATLIASKGWQWTPYLTYKNTLPDGATLPVTYQYQEDYPGNLYALIDPSGQFGWNPFPSSSTGSGSNNINPAPTNPFVIPPWLYLVGVGVGLITILILISRSTGGRQIYPKGATTIVSGAGRAAKNIEREATGKKNKPGAPEGTHEFAE